MCLPVAKFLETTYGFQTHTLALTLSYDLFRSSQMDCSRFLDYLEEDNFEAQLYGEKLAHEHHNSSSAIPLEESIAYLGLSYQDLVSKLGKKEAKEVFSEKGRLSFCPNKVLEKVLRKHKPDIVIVTNSPRAEKAAVEEAKKLGIPTLAMCDLFGRFHFHVLEADHITVLCEETIQNLIDEGVKGVKFHMMGNPAFDRLYDFKKTSSLESRRSLNLDLSKPVLLFADMPAYWDVDNNCSHTRTESEVLLELEELAQSAIELNAHLIIRPHPSQNRDLYEKWVRDKNHPDVTIDPGYELLQILNASDVVLGYTTTVLLEAALMGVSVAQLMYCKKKNDLPLTYLGVAAEISENSQMIPVLRQLLESRLTKEQRLKKVEQVFPVRPATPQIAELIWNIVSSESVLQEKDV